MLPSHFAWLGKKITKAKQHMFWKPGATPFAAHMWKSSWCLSNAFVHEAGKKEAKQINKPSIAFNLKGLGEQSYFYLRMLLICWVFFLTHYHMFFQKFKRNSNKHLILLLLFFSTKEGLALCPYAGVYVVKRLISTKLFHNMFLIRSPSITCYDRLNNMAVIS